MIIIEKNPGTKIAYEVNGTKITFDDQLMLKLTKYEKDWPVHKDICMDADGDLTLGVGDGLWYVAEIDIPARQYEEPEEEGEAPTPLPLDMDTVTLTLWSIDDPTISFEEE